MNFLIPELIRAISYAVIIPSFVILCNRSWRADAMTRRSWPARLRSTTWYFLDLTLVVSGQSTRELRTFATAADRVCRRHRRRACFSRPSSRRSPTAGAGSEGRKSAGTRPRRHCISYGHGIAVRREAAAGPAPVFLLSKLAKSGQCRTTGDSGMTTAETTRNGARRARWSTDETVMAALDALQPPHLQKKINTIFALVDARLSGAARKRSARAPTP